MYIPAHFAADGAAVRELLARHGAADLITLTSDGLLATMLPFAYDAGRRASTAALYGHVARNNDQWRKPALRRVAGHRARSGRLRVPVLVRRQGRARPGRPDLELRHGARVRPARGARRPGLGRRTWSGG